jgi:alcohol dehydrogenase (cytochrome c)
VHARFAPAAALAVTGILASADGGAAQSVDAGRAAFEQRCARCHGADGNGGEMGPAIATRLPALDSATWPRSSATPPAQGHASERDAGRRMTGRPSAHDQREAPPVVRKVRTTDGRTLEARSSAKASTTSSSWPRTSGHLLRRALETCYREVSSETDWPTYNGGPGGNRLTALAQIDKTTVAALAPRWLFTVPGAGLLQVTPVVVGGIMYVTAPNEGYALDAGTGRLLWHYQRPRTKGVAGGTANRGVAVAGDRVFMATATRTSSPSIASPATCSGTRRWRTGARTMRRRRRRCPRATS